MDRYRPLTAGELSLVEQLRGIHKTRLKTLSTIAWSGTRGVGRVCLTRKEKRRIEEGLNLHGAIIVKQGPHGCRVYTLEAYKTFRRAAKVARAAYMEQHSNGHKAPAKA